MYFGGTKKKKGAEKEKNGKHEKPQEKIKGRKVI